MQSVSSAENNYYQISLANNKTGRLLAAAVNNGQAFAIDLHGQGYSIPVDVSPSYLPFSSNFVNYYVGDVFVGGRTDNSVKAMCPYKDGFIAVGSNCEINIIDGTTHESVSKKANAIETILEDQTLWSVAVSGDRIIVGTQARYGRILISNNGGNTWEEVAQVQDFRIRSIAAADDGKTLLAICDTNEETYPSYTWHTGTFLWLISKNGGQSWDECTPIHGLDWKFPTVGQCRFVIYHNEKFYAAMSFYQDAYPTGYYSVLFEISKDGQTVEVVCGSKNVESSKIVGNNQYLGLTIKDDIFYMNAANYSGGTIYGYHMAFKADNPPLAKTTRLYNYQFINPLLFGTNPVCMLGGEYTSRMYLNTTPQYIHS